MAQHDYDIANQSFPSFRSDLNSVLDAINSSNSGSSRPSSAVAGTIWLDTSGGVTAYALKFFDGSDDITLANINTTANTVDFVDSSVASDLINDTTPQLGGNLDVQAREIFTSTSNGNVTLTPDGTGSIEIKGATNPGTIILNCEQNSHGIKLQSPAHSANQSYTLKFPTGNVTAGKYLKVDSISGSGTTAIGQLSFADAGGLNWQSSIVTASTLTAVAGNGYWIDTTSNTCTITLPASASVGDTLEFVDYARNWGTNKIIIDQNSLKYQGGTTPNPEYDTNRQSLRIVYSGASQGWIPTSDDDVSYETDPAYAVETLVVAGGAGGGGQYYSGGGGAGGYRTQSSQTFSPGVTYTVTIGAGGSAGGSVPSGHGGNGGDSSISGTGFTTITSAGGGGGGAGGGSPAVGRDGGSGGGGSGYNDGGAGGGSGNVPSVTPSQGNNGGGNNSTPEGGGGGGGGASAVGETPTSQNGGYGGDGTSNSITGSAVTYAGGGGGADCYISGQDGGAGGAGGGGKGSNQSNDNTAGTANTGGGGGGSYTSTGSAGGSGVVILKILTSKYSGTTSGSPTVTTSGSYKIIKFTGSGSITG